VESTGDGFAEVGSKGDGADGDGDGDGTGGDVAEWEGAEGDGAVSDGWAGGSMLAVE